MVDRWKAIVLSLGMDLVMGEPPGRLHPVVWMGRLVEALVRRAPRRGPVRQLVYGGAVEAACLALAMMPAWVLERLSGSGSVARVALLALALKPTFAVKSLFNSVERVERAVMSGDLALARGAVGRIVSREVGGLDESGVVAAAVESLAENASDSVVAPLLYYALFGLPAAYAYRAANTLDAMLGYRGRFEYLGKVAARVDDLLNLVPSRLTALAIIATSWISGGSLGRAWRAALVDSSRTASPNAGWPMSAVAGALDLRLEKTGHYILNAAGKVPDAGDVRRARRAVGAGLVVALAGIILAARRR